jgi:hypothetical protein
MTTTAKVRVVDQKEGYKILDKAARRYLGISAEEFLQRWDAGEYAGKSDTPQVMRVAQLINLAR